MHRLVLDENLRKANETLVSCGYTDFKVNPVEEIRLLWTIKSKSSIIPFIIIRCKNQISLLAIQAYVKLNIIKRVDLTSHLKI